MPIAKTPTLDADATARRLRDTLAVISPAPGAPDEELIIAAIRQLQGTPEHPVPCNDGCRPCSLARAILLLSEHAGQVSSAVPHARTLHHSARDVKHLVEHANRAHAALCEFEAVLRPFVERSRRLHRASEPLSSKHGIEASHDHAALCTGPQTILQTIESANQQIPKLVERLLAMLRPEQRTIGHRPPDTLLVDLVRLLAGAGYSKNEIGAFVAPDGLSGRDRDYWLDRVDRALRRVAAEDPELGGTSKAP